jgi:hypothetical protein
VPAANAKFLVNVMQMDFDSAFAQAEPVGDRFIRKTVAS